MSLKFAIFPVNSLKAGKPNRLHSAQRLLGKTRREMARDGSRLCATIQIESDYWPHFRGLRNHPYNGDKCPGWVAEREGFEPSVRLRAQRFSRPPRSTTPAPLRALIFATIPPFQRGSRSSGARRLAEAARLAKPRFGAETGESWPHNLVYPPSHPIFCQLWIALSSFPAKRVERSPPPAMRNLVSVSVMS